MDSLTAWVRAGEPAVKCSPCALGWHRECVDTFDHPEYGLIACSCFHPQVVSA